MLVWLLVYRIQWIRSMHTQPVVSTMFDLTVCSSCCAARDLTCTVMRYPIKVLAEAMEYEVMDGADKSALLESNDYVWCCCVCRHGKLYILRMITRSVRCVSIISLFSTPKASTALFIVLILILRDFVWTEFSLHSLSRLRYFINHTSGCPFAWLSSY